MTTSTDRALLEQLNWHGVKAARTNVNGTTVLTTPHWWQWRKRGAKPPAHRDGTRLIAVSTGLLYLLDAGLLAVSIAAQYRYFLAERHQITASMIESAALDAGMVIFSLLALGAARKGLPARVERILIVACALASATMNYANAQAGNWRSIAAWTMPPIFLAVVTDRVIATTRRHFLGMAEGRSAWRDAAAFTSRTVHVAGIVALYLLRFVLAPPSTVAGTRRLVLNATPLPVAPAVPHLELPAAEHELPAAPARARRPAGVGGSKKAALLDLYRQHEGFGDRSRVSPIAAELAPKAGLQAGTARTYLGEAIRQMEGQPT